MPESPEVAALAAWLDERTAGARVRAVDVVEFRVVKTRARPPERLVGARIAGVGRLGKHLDLRLDDAHLIVSLGRNGWVRWDEPDAPAPADPAAPVLASAELTAGTMAFTDAGSWVSLGLWVVDDPGDVPAVASLGPDPLADDLDQDTVDAAVSSRRKQLKAILQEQSSFAGIGNAYSDEILHRARLSPLVHGDRLTAAERGRLRGAMHDVLAEAAAARRDVPIADLKQAKIAAMAVHGREGEPCPVCGDTVRGIMFAGAEAQYCPTCQTGGASLG